MFGRRNAAYPPGATRSNGVGQGQKLTTGPKVVGTKLPERRPYPQRAVTNATNRLVALGLSKGPFQFPPLKGSVSSTVTTSTTASSRPSSSIGKKVNKGRGDAFSVPFQVPFPFPLPSQTNGGRSGDSSELISIPKNPKTSTNKEGNGGGGKAKSKEKDKVTLLVGGKAKSVSSIEKALTKAVATEKIAELEEKVSGLNMNIVPIHDQKSKSQTSSKEALLFDAFPLSSNPKLNRKDTEKEKLRLELHQSRLDYDASERRIARLVRNVEELEGPKDEAEVSKAQLQDVEERLRETNQENEEMKKKLEVYVSNSTKEGKEDRITKQERDCYVSKIKELTLKAELIAEDHKKCGKQLASFQRDFMDALHVTDVELSRSVANGGIGESTKTCGPIKLHNFLRGCVEHLRSEYNGMVKESTSLRTQFHNEVIRADGLSKEVETLSSERKRTLEGFREHESQIEYLSNEIKLLRSFLTDELGKDADDQILALQKENRELHISLAKVQKESDAKISKLKKDLRHEQGRYDQLTKDGIEERKEIENRWKTLWDEHSARMKDEFDTLKANYENPLKSSHVREATLQQQLFNLQDRYNKSKESWEEYRRSLFDQLEECKQQYIIKCGLLDTLKEEKDGFSLMLEEKQQDLEHCQAMLNEGVEERQNLQKKVEALQSKLREFMGLSSATETAAAAVEAINGGLNKLAPSHSWFSITDFKKMKDKMQLKFNEPQQFEREGESEESDDESYSGDDEESLRKR